MNVQSALSAAISVFGIRTADEPHFQIIVKNGANEIRQYGAYWVASTNASGAFEVAREEGYRRLSDYLGGANSSGREIPMMAPVFQSGAHGLWKISFVMPANLPPQRLPSPVSELVHLEGVPAGLVAALKFTGRTDHLDYARRSDDLRQWLRWQSGYLPSSEARMAFYDPPFTIPRLRRNEVQVPVHRTSTLH